MWWLTWVFSMGIRPWQEKFLYMENCLSWEHRGVIPSVRVKTELDKMIKTLKAIILQIVKVAQYIKMGLNSFTSFYKYYQYLYHQYQVSIKFWCVKHINDKVCFFKLQCNKPCIHLCFQFSWIWNYNDNKCQASKQLK